MWRWWYGIRDMKKLQEEGLSAYIGVKKEYMILKETKLCTFFVIRGLKMNYLQKFIQGARNTCALRRKGKKRLLE